ncbi:hypothetical protein A3E96_02650 [Candidatus Uhrbacteria bacterium RIFCSPHIGHO2_12_FULL_46_13]|nr:MAG: hypothetical protein A3D60_03710 [Candidatus Uhrbacteria bacterium RIFCSPHIGHO2_02_FULL_47_29]OGL75807.1 MAG: hypothetical protein A3E96_02650 [Candidatus Uhrbacteria bacterium RIFCSPHIGHO2_12_FULL_46_13]
MAQAETLTNIVKDPLKDVAEKAFLIKRGATVGSPLDLFGLYLSLMLGFAGVVFIVEVVHGGYMWMTAGGNEEQIKKAISRITNGAVGAAVIFFAYLITAFALGLITEGAGIDAGFTQPE